MSMLDRGGAALTVKPSASATTIGLALTVLSVVLLTLSFRPYDQGALIRVESVPTAVGQYRFLPRHMSARSGPSTS